MLSIDLLYLTETLLYTVTYSTRTCTRARTQVAKLVPVPEYPLWYPYPHRIQHGLVPILIPIPISLYPYSSTIVVPVPVFQHSLVPVLVPEYLLWDPYPNLYPFQHGLVPIFVPIPEYPLRYPYPYPCFNMAWCLYSYPYPFHCTRTRVPVLVPVPVFGTRLQLCYMEQARSH